MLAPLLLGSHHPPYSAECQKAYDLLLSLCCCGEHNSPTYKVRLLSLSFPSSWVFITLPSTPSRVRKELRSSFYSRPCVVVANTIRSTHKVGPFPARPSAAGFSSPPLLSRVSEGQRPTLVLVLWW